MSEQGKQITIIVTQRVNDALKNYLDLSGKQLLMQAYANAGGHVSCISPNRDVILNAIRTAVSSGSPVIIMVAEGPAAAEFQKMVSAEFAPHLSMITVVRVAISPAAHIPGMASEDIVDVADVPQRIADAVAAFREMLSSRSRGEQGGEQTQEEIPPDRTEEDKKKEEDGKTVEEGKGAEESKEQPEQGRKFGFRFPWKRGAAIEEETKKDETPRAEPESPSPPMESPARFPSRSSQEQGARQTKTVVLRFPSLLVCALPEEIERARNILLKRSLGNIALVYGTLREAAESPLPPDQIIVVADRRNVREVARPATFILVSNLSPEEAARYLPLGSKIAATFVPQKKVPDHIAKIARNLAVVGEIDLSQI